MFAELILCTVPVQYTIFGVQEPIHVDEVKSVIVGTLSADENITLDILVRRGITLSTEGKNTQGANQPQSSPEKRKAFTYAPTYSGSTIQ